MLHNSQQGITVTLGGQEGLPSLMTNLSLDSQKAPEHGQKSFKTFHILDPTWTIYTIKIQGKQGMVGTNVEVPTLD